MTKQDDGRKAIDGQKSIGADVWPVTCKDCGAKLTPGENCNHFIVEDGGAIKMNL